MDEARRDDSIAIINGVVYPMASPGRVSAIFARGGVIEAVGSDREILSRCGAKTVVLDMKGRFVMPGFSDTHTHLLATGRSLETLNLRDVKSVDTIIRRGKKFFEGASFGKDEWFFARGWDQNRLAEKRFPTRYDLDKITTEVPMFFERSCGHIAALNSRALELLRITRGFKIAGGVVYCDDSGEPTGVVSEAAVNWVRLNIPEHSDETLERWYRLAVDEMMKRGITYAQSDDLEIVGRTERVFRFYEAMEAANKTPIRISQQWHLRDETELRAFIESGYHKRSGRFFTSGALKVPVDGTLGARTAALREEYSDDPGHRGIYAHSQCELDGLVQTAQNAGMQVAFYAIGDGAIERCLNSVETAKAFCAKSGVPHRIVHCPVGAPDIYARMASLGVMADIQPAFVTSDWPIVLSRIGTERARWSYAWKSLLLNEIKVGAGSDAPAEPMDPFVGIRAAIKRQDSKGYPEHGWMPAQCLDRVEVYSLYTQGGAEVCGDGRTRGTLEPGKAADFVAYMQDPFKVPDDELTDIAVGLVVVDGSIRYIN